MGNLPYGFPAGKAFFVFIYFVCFCGKEHSQEHLYTNFALSNSIHFFKKCVKCFIIIIILHIWLFFFFYCSIFKAKIFFMGSKLVTKMSVFTKSNNLNGDIFLYKVITISQLFVVYVFSQEEFLTSSILFKKLEIIC